VGRVEEISRIAECIEEVRNGNPWLVAIEGEAGIGKSSLLWRIAEDLDGFTVLRASCDALESDLPFGLVEQLDSQAAQRFAACGVPPVSSVPAKAGPLVVGAEWLALLGRLQDSSPVGLLLDDVPLADPASQQVLRFVQRRLHADRVLVAISARPGADWPPGGRRGLWGWPVRLIGWPGCG
jgi:predicted ATPase